MAFKKMETYRVDADIPIMVDIGKDDNDFVKIYQLHMPEFGLGTRAMLNDIKSRIVTEVNISSEKMLDAKFVAELKRTFKEKADKLLRDELPTFTDEIRGKLATVLLNEMAGLGPIEFLLSDGNLEEIVVNSAVEPVWVYHKKYGWLKTNIFINPEAEIQNYASIIARRVGKQVTVLSPLLDAHLVTGDRANSTLFPISSRGNTITIRRFRRDPWTATDFISANTANAAVMATIWLAMEYELNIMVSGGTGSGKTTLLNVMLPFIQPNQRVLTIEDTRELTLPDYLHWVPMTTREPNAEGKGSVCMYPGNWLLLGNGELRQIDEYATQCLESRPTFNPESNLLSCQGGNDTVMAGDPEKFTYQSEPISIVSKVTERKFICTVYCKNGETASITENTKLPVIGESGKVELLVPADIQKGKYYLPTFKKIKLELQIQPIETISFFDSHGFYAVGIRDVLSMLLKEAKERGQSRKDVMNTMGHKRQCLNWYLKKDIAPISLLVKLCKNSRVLPLDQLENNVQQIKARGHASPIVKIPKILDEDMAYLGGFLLAEKTLTPNGITFAQKEDLPHIEKIVMEKFGLKLYKGKTTNQYGTYNLYGILSKPAKIFLEKTFELKKSKQIRVPKIVMRSPDDIIAAFLAGFIDGDGSVDGRRITLAAPTEKTAIEFKYLLTRLGIASKIAEGKRIYVVNITRRDSLKIAANAIPFRRLKNKNSSQQIQNTTYSHATKEGLIPALLLRNHLKHLAALSTEEKKHHYYHTRNNHTGMPQKYFQTQLLKQEISSTELEELQILLRDDVEFVEITKVEIKPNTDNIPTYDVTPAKSTYFVAGTHNLTLVMDTMLDLLVNALRMRPDRIIVGEVRRQREAEVMFEAMHTGHSVYATVHANTTEETITRLTSPPIEIAPSLLEAVHLNVVMFRNRRLGVRRILQLAEFVPQKGGSDGKTVLKPNVLFRWRASNDTIEKYAESIRLFDELALHTGFTAAELNQNLSEKQKILEYLVKEKIRDINEVGKVMAQYYSEPETILKKAGVR